MHRHLTQGDGNQLWRDVHACELVPAPPPRAAAAAMSRLGLPGAGGNARHLLVARGEELHCCYRLLVSVAARWKSVQVQSGMGDQVVVARGRVAWLAKVHLVAVHRGRGTASCDLGEVGERGHLSECMGWQP